MREIIFDTETTGLSPQKGDRVIEIGAVELENLFPTGRTYHQYLNSQGHPIHPDAERVHGINAAFLADKPSFEEVAEEFLEFFSGAKLVAHNASFDMGFVNAELQRIGRKPFDPALVVDTLEIARRKFPMGPNSLDALCNRFNVDNSHRQKHGALLDSELLAEVYVELLGGKQASLLLADNNETEQQIRADNISFKAVEPAVSRPEPLVSPVNSEQEKAHRAYVEQMGQSMIWKKYN